MSLSRCHRVVGAHDVVGNFDTRAEALSAPETRARLMRGRDKLIALRLGGCGFTVVDGEGGGPPPSFKNPAKPGVEGDDVNNPTVCLLQLLLPAIVRHLCQHDSGNLKEEFTNVLTENKEYIRRERYRNDADKSILNIENGGRVLSDHTYIDSVLKDMGCAGAHSRSHAHMVTWSHGMQGLTLGHMLTCSHGHMVCRGSLSVTRTLVRRCGGKLRSSKRRSTKLDRPVLMTR